MKVLLRSFDYLFIFLLFSCANCFAQNKSGNFPTTNAQFKIPEPIGFVNDFENLFTAPETKNLETMIMDFSSKTSIQVIIITIDTTLTDRDNFENFSMETYRSWELGSIEKFNGILISLSKKFRKIWLENGNGVRRVLSDHDINNFVANDFLPFLQEEKYYEATLHGMTAIMNKLKL